MRQIIATKPRIVEGDSWFVSFKAWNPQKNKLQLKKIYKGFKPLKSRKEKLAFGENLCRELEAKLLNGWNPWKEKDKEVLIYSDNLANFSESRIKNRRRYRVKNVRYFLSSYLDWKKSQIKKKTFESYTSKLRVFCLWLEENDFDKKDVSELTRGTIIKFCKFLEQEKDLDRLTIEKYQQNLHNFFKWLIEEKWVKKNPVVDIPKTTQKKDIAARPIPKIQLKAFLTHIKMRDKQLFLACLFQYYCFVRPGNELRNLKIQDIDFFNSKLRIDKVHSKNGKSEIIGIPDDLLDVCMNVYQLHTFNPEYYVFGRNRMPGEERLGHNTLRNRFNKFRQDLGMPNIYKFYSFKHSGAGILLESGATMVELMDQLRHKELNTTHHYIKRHFGARSEHVKKNFPNPLA